MGEVIEQPMRMNYRESYAWQVGWDNGVKIQKKEEIEFLTFLLLNIRANNIFRLEKQIDERLKELRE